jgi:DNA-binding transcriptional LysR family regulator
MSRDNINDLAAFSPWRGSVVSRERRPNSVSRQALRHTSRGLEERLRLQLLARTTRRVSLTEAGERLFHDIAPHFAGIDEALTGLTTLREKPARTVRIVAGEHAAHAILWPAAQRLLSDYPDTQRSASTMA